MVFEDRTEAGRILAERLAAYADARPIVLGLPRGGVPVAYEIAHALNAPLDVLVVRKLGAPQQPEFGFGSVAPGGVRIVDERVVGALGISGDEVETIVENESRELGRRLRAYRGDAAFPDLTGRTVILVDDGVATGVSMRAAIEAVQAVQPERLVVTVPVGAPDTIDAFRDAVDDVVVVEAPENFRAVGLWYTRFDQVTDDEVVDVLSRAREREVHP